MLLLTFVDPQLVSYVVLFKNCTKKYVVLHMNTQTLAFIPQVKVIGSAP